MGTGDEEGDVAGEATRTSSSCSSSTGPKAMRGENVDKGREDDEDDEDDAI